MTKEVQSIEFKFGGCEPQNILQRQYKIKSLHGRPLTLESSFIFPICRSSGFLITKMVEDGSCLFRAVADQIYGDQEMHPCVRRNCMDYIVSRFRRLQL